MIAYLVGGEFCHKIQSFVGREKGELLMVVQLLFLHIEAKLNPTIKVKFTKRKKRNKKVVSAKKQKQQ